MIVASSLSFSSSSSSLSQLLQVPPRSLIVPGTVPLDPHIMASVLTKAQQIIGLVVVTIVLLCGAVVILGGTVGGWFSTNSNSVSLDENSLFHDSSMSNSDLKQPQPQVTSVLGFADDLDGDHLGYGQPEQHMSSNSLQRVDHSEIEDIVRRYPHIKGEKGEPGQRGPPGHTVRGLQGPPGPPGPPGFPGPMNTGGAWSGRTTTLAATCSCNETMMRQFMREMLPPPQPHLPPMPPGVDRGVMRSPQGPPGPPGAPGRKGERGEPGPEGLIGPKGAPGRDGLPGLPGPPGPPGPQMMYAPMSKYGEMNWGKKNVFHDEMVKFSPNYQPNPRMGGGVGGGGGDFGSRGEKGEMGPQGPRGDQGDKGERGFPGPKGNKGERGWEGTTGPPGPKGDPGRPGSPGIPARHGNKGEKGEPGPPGPPSNGGRYNLARDMENLISRDGLKGDKGDPGAPGTPGRPGPPGQVIHSGAGQSVLRERVVFLDKGGDKAGTTSALFVVQDSDELLDTLFNAPVGTIVFIASEDAIAVKHNKSWRLLKSSNREISRRRPNPVSPQDLSKPGGGQDFFPFREDNANEIEPLTPSPPPLKNSVAERYHHRPPPPPRGHPNSLLFGHKESRQLRLVALDYPRTGSLHGAQAVDYQCFRQSEQANIEGSFRAFLAPSMAGGTGTLGVRNLKSIVRYQDRKLPVVNLRGETLFESWDGIFEGRAMLEKHSGLYSFSGKNVLQDDQWVRKLVWHGSNLWGDASHDCQGWRSENPLEFGLASDLEAQDGLLGQKKVPCNHQLVVLCIETTTGHTMFST